MAKTVEFRLVQLEQQCKPVEAFEIVLRFVDPTQAKPDRVVVMDVPGYESQKQSKPSATKP